MARRIAPVNPQCPEPLAQPLSRMKQFSALASDLQERASEAEDCSGQAPPSSVKLLSFCVPVADAACPD